MGPGRAGGGLAHAGAWNGGTLATAGGLVFQGRADGHFAAYAAGDGALLWETPTYTGIIAPPVTYAVDGEQYVTVVAGWGGAFGVASGIPAQEGNRIEKGRLLVYRLGGEAELPEPDVEARALPEPPPLTADAETVDHGMDLFQEYCSVCHGNGAVGSGVLPDLRYSAKDVHESWNAIVLDGAYGARGMVGFDHVLDAGDAEAIRQYVIKRARDAREIARYRAERADDEGGAGEGG